ncbi:MAG: ribose-5-phosphate isomerase RpiA [Spirochaetales bacterium]|nr:ribose-5-phosphate isomerase RpiA [Spirochaetales bacterium]
MNDKEIKREIGKKAVDDLVKNGMKLGLGTGSTAIEAIRRVGEKIKSGELKDIRVVPTSMQTEMECRSCNIPLWSLNDPDIKGKLDLTIDGADEVDPQMYLIKGGGGALLLEKIVAFFSKRYAIIVDSTKMVKTLGLTKPVPVEIIPSALYPVSQAVEELGASIMIRMGKQQAGPVITRHGNIILDIRFSGSFDPVEMEKKLKLIPGVVENGIFTIKVTDLFIGYEDGWVDYKNG